MKRLICLVRGHRRPNLGCIDPHGMWPFAASREVCDKCRAIRQRIRCRRCNR